MIAGDLEHRSFIVTGANTGIGKVTAGELAKRGAHVVLACRAEAKARPVIDAIVRETGNQRVDFLYLDLADLKQVRSAAKELLDRGHPIHCLINNAGLAGQRGQTADGFELTFGVNHLGPFLFTTLLLERMQASAPARIVNVASKAHYDAEHIDFAKLRRPTKTVTGLAEYAVSKVSNVLFAKALASRLLGTGVTTYSLHPGVIASDIWRRIPWPIRPLLTRRMKSTFDGAQTSLYCATDSAAASETGLYYHSSKVRTPSPLAEDASVAAELWRMSDAWCQEVAPVTPGSAVSS